MKAFLQVGLCVLVFMASGCGGGGSPPSAQTAAVVPLATRLRMLRSGDIWRYRVTSTIGNGSMAATVISDQRDGETFLDLTTVAILDGRSFRGTSYGRQDAITGDLTLHASGEVEFTPPVVLTPGTWGVGVGFTRDIITQDEVVNASLSVQDEETVTVPAGTFRTWKTQRIEHSSRSTTTGTYWYAPQLGNYVWAQVSTTFLTGQFAGQSSSVTLVLNGTNVPTQ